MDEVDYLWRSSRCPQAVRDFANRMAQALPQLEGLQRPDLQPWEGREDQGTVEIVAASTPQIEARWVVRKCESFLAEGIELGDIIVVAAGYVGDVLAGLRREVKSRAGLAFHFFDPRTPNPFAGDLAIRLLSAGLRPLISPEDQMAWRRLVAETPGVAEARLKRILAAGEATYVRNLVPLRRGTPFVPDPSRLETPSLLSSDSRTR
jgi:superfamily I DNA/RNA helicase